MSLIRLQRSPFASLTVVVALASFLATLLPPRSARADAGDGLAPVGGAAGIGPRVTPNTVTPAEAPGTVDLSMGAAQTSYPFHLPAARGDAQPSLGLTYNSRNGVGFAGVGWSLNVPSITRRGRSGIPRFADAVLGDPSLLASDPNTDDYYIDGKLLIPVDATTFGTFDDPPANRYVLFRAEVDDGNRYFFSGTGFTWLMQTKTGHLLQFGLPLDGGPGSTEQGDGATVKTFAPVNNAPANPIYRWNLVRESDATGNTVIYQWDDETKLFTNRPGAVLQYLTDIFDTSSAVPTTDKAAALPSTSTFAHHVHLTWTLAQYPSGAPATLTPLPYAHSPIWKALPWAQLSSVDVTSATASATPMPRQLVRRYQLTYLYNPTQTRAFLTSIQPIGTCQSQGSPIVETNGVIGTDSATTFRLVTCSGTEHMPPTKYAYTGVDSNGSPVPPSTFPSPTIIAKTPAYSAIRPRLSRRPRRRWCR